MKKSWQKTALDALYSATCICACLLVGHFISQGVGGLPRSLYGLIIFTTLLHYGVIKARKIQASIAWGIRHMGVCFVPAGVGIIEHFELIKHHGIAIVALTFITTLLLLTLVGFLYQRYESSNTKEVNVHGR